MRLKRSADGMPKATNQGVHYVIFPSPDPLYYRGI